MNSCCKKMKVLNLTWTSRVVFLFIVTAVALSFALAADAGVYLDSAHGNSSSGVKRSATGFPTDYTRGLCAHCHEKHASIDGDEPAPTGGPSDYTLFDDNYLNQTNGICFECHTDVSSYQTGGSLVNRSYSYRAGGWTGDTVNDILEAFSFSSPGTSHNLDNIMTFITGKWGYTDDSNPCNACHNPHAAQGDPLGAPNNAKSSGTRGYPVSLPQKHNKDNNLWELYGDDADEKMSYDYPTSYQAPYRYNSSTTYEPDGSAVTQDGSNLTNYVAFCTDCHNQSNTIWSDTLSRNLYTINYSGENKHGGVTRTVSGDIYDKGTLKAPYNDASSYVLSCLDCHEPHGSKNAYLLRSEVNGVVISGAIDKDDNSNGAWNEFCSACHNITITSAGGDVCVAAGTPGEDHGAPFATSLCTNCHYHGKVVCSLDPGPGPNRNF